MPQGEQVHTLIIGGGQAGLAAGYYLKKLGLDCLILDAAERTGDSWRRRWDSLRLFTPSKFNGLPGKQFQKADFYFPTKDEVADYLGEYVHKFNLPVRHGVTVECVAKKADVFTATAGEQQFVATNIIIATGAYKNPVMPPCAKHFNSSIVQLHSDDYRNPEQMPQGPILVVGAGNSGAEISMELSNTGRKVWLAGRDVGRIPAETLGYILGGHPYWLLLTRVLNVNTPIGRKMRSQAHRLFVSTRRRLQKQE
jgi:putative flavoprotein involved in K+ transport